MNILIHNSLTVGQNVTKFLHKLAWAMAIIYMAPPQLPHPLQKK